MTAAAILTLLATWTLVISISGHCIWKVFHAPPGPGVGGTEALSASRSGVDEHPESGSEESL